MSREDQWQPIETAPKDGTEILVFDAGAIFISLWFTDPDRGEQGWWDNGIVEPPPTHWMPLPDPPKVGSGTQPSRDRSARAHLVAHVGCGSVDEAGQCLRCDAIRAILRNSSPSSPSDPW